MDTAADENDFEFDVALSFHSKDEATAQQLADRLSDRFTVFIYSEQQKILAGRDGEQTFNAVYGQKARVVVVLHRQEWGETPFTRIEQTAIRNRAFEEGFDFTVFIPTDGKGAPKWLPKTRLWVGLDRWGLDGAAAVIEAKIQEQGGLTKSETATERAARLQRARSLVETKERYRKSLDGVQASKRALGELTTALEVEGAKIKDFRMRVVREYLVFDGLGPWMTIYWHAQYSNVLDGSYLRVEILTGPPQIPGLTVWSEPKRLSSKKFDFGLLGGGSEIGYVQPTGEKREFSISAMTEYILNHYLEFAEKHPTQ